MLAVKERRLTMRRVQIERRFQLMPSGCAPDGSIVLVRCPEGLRLTVAFDDDGSKRDHTAWMADFAMIGWFNAANGSPAPADGMEVAHLILSGGTVDEIEAWWVHPASGSSHMCDGPTLMLHVARGIAVQIAEAVASEVLDENPVPDDLSETGDQDQLAAEEDQSQLAADKDLDHRGDAGDSDELPQSEHTPRTP